MVTITVTPDLLGGVVRRIYQPGITPSVVAASRLWHVIPKATKDEVTFGGEGYASRIALLLEWGESTGFRSEADTQGLPAYNRQDIVQQAVITPASIYGSMQMSWHAFDAQAVEAGSFARDVNFFLQGTLARLKRDIAQSGWGDSSGQIATISDATLALLANPVVAGTAVAVSTVVHIDVGMFLDSFNGAGVQSINSNRVTAVDDVNNTVTFADNFANPPLTDQRLFREDSRNKHCNGLNNIVDGPDSAGAFAFPTLHGVSGATFPKWAANVLSNAAAPGVPIPFDMDTLQSLLDFVDRRGQARTNFMVFDHNLRRSFINQLTPDRRYIATETLSLGGGFSGLSYQGGADPIPMTADLYCLPNRIFGLDTNYIRWAMAHEFDFVASPTGSIFRLVTQGGVDIHAYRADVFAVLQMLTKKRNAHFVWRDVA